MVFVSSLNLREFRGIREFKEPLELAKFNILVGRNNSGKSAILHALSLLPHPNLHLPMDLSIENWNYRRDVFRYLLGEEKSAIYRYAGSAFLEFNVEGKACLEEIKEDGNYNFFVEDESVDAPTCCERLGIKEERAKNCVAFVPNESIFLRRLQEHLMNRWEPIEKSEAPARVVEEIINISVDETFTEILVRERELYARKGVSKYVRVRDLGDGIQRILNVLLWLETCAPELVLWDDFEASVHPTLIKLVLEWLTKKDWQVVIATHSIDVLLKLLDTELESKDCSLILLQKTSDDILLHNRLTLEELEDFVISNQDPRLLPDLLKL